MSSPKKWGEQSLYCVRCSSPKLIRLGHNTKFKDFSCPSCQQTYQLKSQKTRIGKTIADGAYDTMISAIRNGDTPNFLFLHYDQATWKVINLLYLPSFALTETAIIKRKPLAPTARRAGWTGCNISLTDIPPETLIGIIKDSRIAPIKSVRERCKNVEALESLPRSTRSWAINVLNELRRLGLEEFETKDAYTLEGRMSLIYPDNNNVRAKIRQQLQVLRDIGLLLHLDKGLWSLPQRDS